MYIIVHQATLPLITAGPPYRPVTGVHGPEACWRGGGGGGSGGGRQTHTHNTAIVGGGGAIRQCARLAISAQQYQHRTRHGY